MKVREVRKKERTQDESILPRRVHIKAEDGKLHAPPPSLMAFRGNSCPDSCHPGEAQ